MTRQNRCFEQMFLIVQHSFTPCVTAKLFSHVPVISRIIYFITGMKSQIPSISDKTPNWVPSARQVHPIWIFYSVIQRQSYIQLFGCCLRFAQFSQFILSYTRFSLHATKKKGKRGLECHSTRYLPHSPHIIVTQSTLLSASLSIYTLLPFLINDH